MNSLYNHLRGIHDTGRIILDLLKGDDPDMERVEYHYEVRAKQIELMEKEFKTIPSLADNKQKEVQTLFLQLQQMEEKLNSEMSVLYRDRLESFRKADMLSKAASSYSSNSSGSVHSPSRFIDKAIG